MAAAPHKQLPYATGCGWVFFVANGLFLKSEPVKWLIMKLKSENLLQNRYRKRLFPCNYGVYCPIKALKSGVVSSNEATNQGKPSIRDTRRFCPRRSASPVPYCILYRKPDARHRWRANRLRPGHPYQSAPAFGNRQYRRKKKKS